MIAHASPGSGVGKRARKSQRVAGIPATAKPSQAGKKQGHIAMSALRSTHHKRQRQ